MPRYASSTVVATEKTQGQVRKLIERYGGDRVSFAWADDDTETELVIFRWRSRWYRFAIPHPPKATSTIPGKDTVPPLTTLTDPRDRELRQRWQNGYKTWAQLRTHEIARRWRVLLDLLLTPLFKLSEEEPERAETLLMAHTMLPSGQTVAERIVTEVTRVYETKDEATFRFLDEPTPIALGAGR